MTKPYTDQDLENIIILSMMDGWDHQNESLLNASARKYFEGKGWSFHTTQLMRWDFYGDLLRIYNKVMAYENNPG